MIYSERTNRTALIVKDNGETERLSRVPFMNGSFNEAWLQELLENNPALIPSAEVNGSYYPLVCIGREVPVGSGETQGFIDNLYVTPNGHIVIVETKLFRNQESRRTVVAQIIDYAKELQKWDCEKLDKLASDYFFSKSGQSSRIIDVMVSLGYLSISDEASLTDKINKSLETASFLLMIIGDGIRSNVQQLADFLNDNTSMSFNLALAEMEVYQNGSDTIVIPNLVTKTSVIERPVYLNGTEQSVFSSIEEHTNQYVRKPLLTRREFISVFAENGGFDPDVISEFISDLEAISGVTIEIAPTELTVRLQFDDNTDTCALITFSISRNHADSWIVPGRVKAALLKHGVFPFEADIFFDFFKKFIDVQRCKTAPYENEAGFYYVDLCEVLNNSRDMISEVEKFAVSINKQ